MQAEGSELDMMVLAFTCKDSSKFGAVGKQSKEWSWKVAAMGAPPVDITVSLEKQPMFSPEVGISADGKKLFPAGGERGKMHEDFVQKWSFRGQAKHVDKRNFWEVRPKAMGDNWFPASSLSQRMDGLFEAVVWLPDVSGGVKQIVLPEVDKSDVREVATKALIDVPVRSVLLRVPQADPLGATSFSLLDGAEEEPVTYSMARPTPAPGPSVLPSQSGGKALQMELSKDRKHLTTTFSHNHLSSYMASNACAVSYSVEHKTKCTWKLMLGPYAEHTITLEKKAAGAGAQAAQLLSGGGGLLKGGIGEMAEQGILQKSEVVSLLVDGTVLVEGCCEDFDADWETPECPNVAGECAWLCRFRFAGERSIQCKVFETNADGITLDSTGLIECLREDQKPVSRICTVAVHDLADLSTAKLDIDGIAFSNLREFTPIEGAPIAGDPEALALQYGIQVPQKTRDIPPLGIIQEKLQAGGAALAANLKDHWEKSQPVLKEQWEQAQGALGRLQEGMGQWFKKESSPSSKS